jgi:DNA-binding NarL/FixJ family response regulator
MSSLVAGRERTSVAERRCASMNIRVLVADDFPLVREGMVRALERDPGIVVVAEAEDAGQLLLLAERHEPDVIVLEMQIAGLGGAVVLERLRTLFPQISVLVVTGSESPEQLLDAVAGGALGYLSKRVAGEELRQAVITTFGGGSVLAPDLAAGLVREYSAGQRGEGSSVRPLLAGREMDVLRLVADGLTDNEIGAQLYISPRTVQNHLTRIREKTGLRRRSALARWAVERSIA